MIRRLCTEEAAGAELTDKLTENLKETLCDNKVTLVILMKSVTLGSSHDESASVAVWPRCTRLCCLFPPMEIVSLPSCQARA